MTSDSHYRMRHPGHRDDARSDTYAAHVRDLNEFVDDLRRRKPGSHVPYVSPEFGGCWARLLLLNLSPGEQTKPDVRGGSGFLSSENTDVGAQRIAQALDHARIDLTECVAWNVYPYYHRGLGGMRAHEQEPFLRDGTGLLIHAIARMPSLRAVFVFGDAPARAWKQFGIDYPRTRRALEPGPHGRPFRHRSTGPQGYIGTNTQQAEWRNELFTEMRYARTLLDEITKREGPPPKS